MTDPNQLPVLVTSRITDSDHIDLECRFPDGQKFATIQVDDQYDELAQLLIVFLNNPQLVAQAIAIMEA